MQLAHLNCKDPEELNLQSIYAFAGDRFQWFQSLIQFPENDTDCNHNYYVDKGQIGDPNNVTPSDFNTA